MIVNEQQSLLAALRQPDIEQPLKQMYASYFEPVIAQICANGGSRDDGADIFQEAVLVLIEKVKTGQFRGDSSIKTFLSAIARNLWLHELRSRNRRGNRESKYMTGTEGETAPSSSFMEKDQANALQAIMEQIGEPCHKILTGFYYENKSMRELLTEFNYENEQVLRNRKSRCMKKLKELIAGNAVLLKTLKSYYIYE